MKTYIKPEMEIIELSMQDCITTSVTGGWDEDEDSLVDEEE